MEDYKEKIGRAFKGVNISCFKDVRCVEPFTAPLITFLTSEKIKNKVDVLRLASGSRRQELKKSLPCATISGIFSKRCTSGLIEHTGLIAIDIDAKDNPAADIDGAEAFKAVAAQLPYVAYAGKSVSGEGVFAICRIQCNYHNESFQQIQEDFRQRGVVVDKGCCDVTRLRFISYDNEPYVNPGACILELSPSCFFLQTKKGIAPIVPKITCVVSNDYFNADKILKLVERTGRKLCCSYQEWLEIGFALADLGENGRWLFQRVSMLCPEKYDRETADRKFTELLEAKPTHKKKITIATFFYKMREALR